MRAVGIPHIAVTLSNPEAAADPEVAALKNRRYLEAVERAGATPLPLDERSSAGARTSALARMDGLLITGGADLDPATYGEQSTGSRAPDPGRDALDMEAYRVATARNVPVLGVCRGLQAINAFAGGTLVQHLTDHESATYPSPNVTRHRLDLVAGSRLAVILGEPADLQVNSYHHQAVTAERLAPGLRASATAPHPHVGELVEAVEATDPDRWLIGVQCHPERTESSPPVLERLWAAFVAACRDRATADRSLTAARRP
jgi:putative glutamine amidotransferase